MQKKVLFTFCMLVFVLTFCLNTHADYKKVDVKKEGVPVSDMGVYKDTDYSFLKKFDFAGTYTGKVDANLITAQVMYSGDDPRVKDGAVVKTSGFYKAGDGGAGVYKISEKSQPGSIDIGNNLYATLIPDTKVINGKKWAIVNAKQVGAHGDGKTPDHAYLNHMFGVASLATESDDIFRAIAYIPTGEYKSTAEVQFGVHDINIVGDGDSSVIFTDNDYSVWWEFFMSGTGSKNLYLGDFKVEAREVDKSNYYRQFVFVDSSNCYMYHVNLNVPQEAFSKDFYMDKQYTNLTFYAGNKDMTVDSCRLDLMCATYRGANIGVLDFYCRGEENITIMNCELYDNARDEQVGMFTGNTNRDASFLKNIYFINNDMYTYQPLDMNAAGGHRTMCFTVAYSMSQNIDNIRIAGNHFKSQVDSKFMTFGNLTNCVVENNIIEADCTMNMGSFLFESSAKSTENLKIRGNEIYITREGKASLVSGNAQVYENKIVTDASSVGSIAYLNAKVYDNKIIGIGKISNLVNNITTFTGNSVDLYGGFDHIIYINGSVDNKGDTTYINNNVIKYYKYNEVEKGTSPFDSIAEIKGALTKNIEFTGNTFLCPNTLVTNQKKNDYGNLFWFRDTAYDNVTVKNNVLQNRKGYSQWGSSKIEEAFKESGNTYKDCTYDESKKAPDKIKILQNSKEVTEIFTTQSSVTLTTNIDDAVWVTSVEGMATADKGVVKRKNYGEVAVFVVSTHSTGSYGKCIVHFEKAVSSAIELEKDSITLQPGKKHDVVYKVLPYGDVSQDLKWESSDKEIAKVNSEGIIEAVKAGKAVITCTTLDGTNIKKKINVTVDELTVKSINLNASELHNNNQGCAIGSSYQLKVTSYYPSNAVNCGVKRWESSNEKVATVSSDGLVKMVGQGYAVIRAYSLDEKCAGVCKVWVTPKAVKNLKETHNSKSVSLTWDEQENVEGYAIYKYNNDKAQWELAQRTTRAAHTFWNMTPDTDYKFMVTAYISRMDSSYQRQYYETKTATISAHTYTKSVIDNFGNTIPASIGLKKGACQDICIYKDKKEYKWWIDNESIATVKDESPNYDARLRVTGVKDGFTYLYIQALDEGRFTVKVPVCIYEFESYDDAQATGFIKSVGLKFVANDTDNITSFKISVKGSGLNKVIDVAKNELGKETIDSKQYYTYVIGGLKDETKYEIYIKPCIIKDQLEYSGGGSKKLEAVTEAVINITAIDTVKTIDVYTGSTFTIKAKVSPDNVSINKLKWIPFDDSIVTFVSESINEAGEHVAVFKTLRTGTVKISAVALDNDGFSTDITVTVKNEEKKEEKQKKEEEQKKKEQQKEEAKTETSKKNKTVIYTVKGYKYRIMNKKEVRLVGAVNKNRTTVNVAAVVTIKGKKYKVTSIGPNAFKNYKKLVKVVVSKNVKAIGKNAFLNINKNAAFYVPKDNENYYKKMINSAKGFKNSMSFRVKNGTVYVAGGYRYKVVSPRTVMVIASTNRGRKVIDIKDTVKLGGITYKVTGVYKNAFKNYKNAVKIVIGSNVRAIGANAFYGDKKVKQVDIKSKVLKSVGKNAFKGIYNKAKLRAYPKYKAKYKKLTKIK